VDGPGAAARAAAEIPPWLQEVILHCLEPEAAQRPPSAAHLAFDLGDPEQVQVGRAGCAPSARRSRGSCAAGCTRPGMHYEPSPLPSERVGEVPIVMVAGAAPRHHRCRAVCAAASHQTLAGHRPGARLPCVTVGGWARRAGRRRPPCTATTWASCGQWARGLDGGDRQLSFHVLQSDDVAARCSPTRRPTTVSLIVMGAATHGLALKRWIPTVPARRRGGSTCSVLLVKDAPPFALLSQAAA
jgi:hypothetical protein